VLWSDETAFTRVLILTTRSALLKQKLHSGPFLAPHDSGIQLTLSLDSTKAPVKSNETLFGTSKSLNNELHIISQQS